MHISVYQGQRLKRKFKMEDYYVIIWFALFALLYFFILPRFGMPT